MRVLPLPVVVRVTMPVIVVASGLNPMLVPLVHRVSTLAAEAISVPVLVVGARVVVAACAVVVTGLRMGFVWMAWSWFRRDRGCLDRRRGLGLVVGVHGGLVHRMPRRAREAGAVKAVMSASVRWCSGTSVPACSAW